MGEVQRMELRGHGFMHACCDMVCFSSVDARLYILLSSSSHRIPLIGLPHLHGHCRTIDIEEGTSGNRNTRTGTTIDIDTGVDFYRRCEGDSVGVNIGVTRHIDFESNRHWQ